jgi:hypothetical protein
MSYGDSPEELEDARLMGVAHTSRLIGFDEESQKVVAAAHKIGYETGVRRGADDEREACAEIANAIEYPANFNLQRSGAWIDCQEAIVAAIRARGAK